MDDQIKFKQAAATILVFEQNLPSEPHIPESYVTLYHKNITDIETATTYDLEHFRIPDSEIKKETKWSNLPPAPGSKITHKIEGMIPAYGREITYCERAMFAIQLRGLVTFLNMLSQSESPASRTIGFA